MAFKSVYGRDYVIFIVPNKVTLRDIRRAPVTAHCSVCNDWLALFNIFPTNATAQPCRITPYPFFALQPRIKRALANRKSQNKIAYSWKRMLRAAKKKEARRHGGYPRTLRGPVAAYGQHQEVAPPTTRTAAACRGPTETQDVAGGTTDTTCRLACRSHEEGGHR